MSARSRTHRRALAPAVLMVGLASVSGLDAVPAAGQEARGAAVATPEVSADRRSGLEPLLQLRGEPGDAPITIESDELELQALPDDSRVLRFERNVFVKQGEVELRADALEAYYPPGAPEPSRLSASGHVRVDQPGQRATCEEAEYLRAQDRLTCRGRARLVRGCDVVHGDAIELDLTAERAKVTGAARVVISPPEDEANCGSPQGAERDR